MVFMVHINKKSENQIHGMLSTLIVMSTHKNQFSYSFADMGGQKMRAVIALEFPQKKL